MLVKNISDKDISISMLGLIIAVFPSKRVKLINYSIELHYFSQWQIPVSSSTWGSI